MWPFPSFDIIIILTPFSRFINFCNLIFRVRVCKLAASRLEGIRFEGMDCLT